MAIGSAIGAVVGAGASLLGASKASKAQRQAADQAAATERMGIEEQRRQYDLTRSDYAPYREAGYGALTDIVSGVDDGSLVNAPDPGAFREDPGYRFSFDEGMRAAMRGAAASGSIGSGGTLKALTRYGQGMADQQYGTWYDRQRQVQGDKFNRLAAIAGIGQTATNATAQAGANAAGNIQQGLSGIANTQLQAGNARASGYASMAQGVNNAIGMGMNAYTMNNMFGGGQAAPVGDISVTPMNKRWF